VVAITGSVGKTTTTDAIAAVLGHPDARRQLGRVETTHNNMNSDLMLPLATLGYMSFPASQLEQARLMAQVPWRALSLLVSRTYPDVFVAECGAGRYGNVRTSARLVRPLVGVVTAVGPAHLAHFGSVENVARAKAALVEAVPSHGRVILGADNEHSAAMRRRCRAPVVLVPGRGADLAHGIARAVAEYLQVPRDAIERALDGVAPLPGRQRIVRTPLVMIIDDAYNANPMSMRLGLDTLTVESLPPGGRRVAVLGAMVELGADAAAYHAEIGAYARERADLVIGVGEMARHYAADLWFATAEHCAATVHEWRRPGDRVLVKGSHVIRMSLVVETLSRAS
jgi:UDP-N-acetylmuramoyl-tripeptide--D-alanyl-D-alanine ligase